MNETRDAVLRCRCGEVEGRVTNASPKTVNRVICYCDDCQAFAHYLKRADLLDANGGSDIIQVAPNTVTFQRGEDRIRGMRLSPKGLYRWYASCCGTPVGNTVSPAIPFVGILAQSFTAPDEAFGKPTGGILGKFATGTPPPGTVKPNLKLLAGAIATILGWRIRGKAWPHPFFDRASGKPRSEVTVIPREERDALRALCGPKPA